MMFLLLCFPVTCIIPIVAAAFAASGVPEIPLLKKQQKQGEK